jgi:hypothetical protein
MQQDVLERPASYMQRQFVALEESVSVAAASKCSRKTWIR